MGKVEVQYRWRYYDEARRRWVKTSYWTTEERIRIEHPDAEPIDGTRQERVLLDNPMDEIGRASCRERVLRLV